jgi:hypothetical protein
MASVSGPGMDRLPLGTVRNYRNGNGFASRSVGTVYVDYDPR